MPTHSSHRLNRQDTRTMWFFLAIIAIAVLSYAVYASYRVGNTQYSSNTVASTGVDTTTSTTNQ